MPRHRRRYALVPDCQTLERRLIPSALIASVVSGGDLVGDDPLPDLEESPGPDPGTSTPITPPPLPPSGPIGPGTT